MNHPHPHPVDSISEIDLANRFGNIDALFSRADADGDGYMNGLEAKNFFPQYGLPNTFLSMVWTNCVTNSQRGMSRSEFTRAMKFVSAEMEGMASKSPAPPAQQQQQHQQYMQHLQPPPLSPAVVVAGASPSPSPNPMMMAMMGGSGMNSPSFPSSSIVAAAAFGMTAHDRAGYEQHFIKLSHGATTVSGDAARGFFLQSKLDPGTLRQIWQLSDMNMDGALDRDEFFIAMHLIRLKVKSPSLAIPAQLPPALLSSARGIDSDLHMLSSPSVAAAAASGRNSASLFDMQPRGASPAPSSNSYQPSRRTSFSSTSMPPLPPGIDQNALIKSSKALHDSVQMLLNDTRMLSTDMFTTQNQVTDRREQLEQLKKQEHVYREKMQHMKQELERARQEREQLDSDLSGYNGRMEVLLVEKDTFERELTQLKAELDRLRNVGSKGEESVTGLNSEIEELEGQVQFNHMELMKRREEIMSYKYSHDSNLQRREELESSVRMLKQQLAALQEEHHTLRTEVDQLSSKLTVFESTKQEYLKATEKTRAQVEDMQRKKQELSQQLTSTQRQLVDYEQQFSSSGNKAKLQRLKLLAEKMTENFNEFNKLMQEQETASAAVATATTKTAVPSFTAQQQPPQRSLPSPQAPQAPALVAPDAGDINAKDFASEFDDQFDEFEKKSQIKSNPAPGLPQQVEASPAAFDDFGFGDDVFGDFGSVAATASTTTPTASISAAGASGTVVSTPVSVADSTQSSGNQSAPFGFDDDDDFSSPTTSKSPASTVPPTSAVAAADVDDGWGSFEAPPPPPPPAAAEAPKKGLPPPMPILPPVPKQHQPVPVVEKHSANDDGFGDDFGASFDAPAITSPPVFTNATATATASLGWGENDGDAFEDFKNDNSTRTKTTGFDDFDFGADFGAPVQGQQQQQQQQTPALDAWGDFDAQFD